jgi:DNA-binding NarL/FixJ family response regulator
MSATIEKRNFEIKSGAGCRRKLPQRIRILYITTRERTGAWLAEALSTDSSVHVDLEEALGTTAGLARLRDEIFDAVLVSHLPGELDALALIEGYRAGGADEPILVLGAQCEQEMSVLCYEAGADGYLSIHTATLRNLIWVLARAVEHHQLQRENQRLTLSEQSRLHREHDEADRLLKEQRALIGDLQSLGHESCDSVEEAALPGELYNHYRELLRTYVIMGSGNVGDELKRLADMMVRAGLTARQTMKLHLKVLEELIHGLGSLSTRHVMTRANLLVLEIMVHLAEGYQRHYQEEIHPPR